MEDSVNVITSIGASYVNANNNRDPRVFTSLQVTPDDPSRATPHHSAPTPRFLIDSGATHNSRAAGEIQLSTPDNPKPSPFIVTRLKDAYDGILGMPWLREYGHKVNWGKGVVNDENSPLISTAQLQRLEKEEEETPGAHPERGGRIEVSPTSTVRTPGQDASQKFATTPRATLVSQENNFNPPRSQQPQKDLVIVAHPREERYKSANETTAYEAGPEVAVNQDEQANDIVQAEDGFKGVQTRGQERVQVSPTPGQNAAVVVKTLPSATFVSHHPLPVSEPIGIVAARTSWSTSARIAVKTKKAANTPKLEVEQLIPECYHRHLTMFSKKEAQTLPPDGDTINDATTTLNYISPTNNIV
ncbi:hypothetical protein Pst134EA_017615 [Puccinia striiformis f. sp. tritici]|uniref:hypothetical protein n=1 Tax=Puccinia striiformis f. sp. tritici TaxID=168172 RepID=UPI002008A91F|nr:hypothetical protein Pst134EA_017615 [Puccinia striiformis f. sp. tritici]KAH9461307.1 hypothetical protein Pst134EA_017615 [Puccinia striiformis f. sp. tritici]